MLDKSVKKKFEIGAIAYLGMVVFIVTLNGVLIEPNLPIKELADLNQALDGVEKVITLLDSQIKINNEGEGSHNLAYFILSVITILFLIKALKPEDILGSSPNVPPQVTPGNINSQIIPYQHAEAAGVQIEQKIETSLICFQSIESC